VIAQGRGVLKPLAFSPLVELLILVICVGTARAAAMAFNRLADADFDTINPRTSMREIPAGLVSRREAAALVLVSSSVFFLCAYTLGFHCFILSPFVLFVLCGYSYVKRYSPSVHFFLGLALALAPGGAWWVLRPELGATPIALMLAVLFWVAGFDIIYSCQDVAFDRSHGLQSMAARLGVESALALSRILHALAWFLFVLFGVLAQLAPAYFYGMLFFGLLLVYEHRLVSAFDLSRVNRAFFTVNGVISVFYFLLVYFSA